MSCTPAGGDKLVSCVQLLLSAGAEVNAAERHKMTPLMFACKGDRSDIVALLIKAGAQLNMQDNKGSVLLGKTFFGVTYININGASI